MAYTFVNGILLGTGFEIQSSTPIDRRSVVPTGSDLDMLYKHDGLMSYVQEEGIPYWYNLEQDSWNSLTYLAEQAIVNSYVPYLGALTDVDLGIHSLFGHNTDSSDNFSYGLIANGYDASGRGSLRLGKGSSEYIIMNNRQINNYFNPNTYIYTFPKATGYFLMSINGNFADSLGNINLSTSGTQDLQAVLTNGSTASITSLLNIQAGGGFTLSAGALGQIATNSSTGIVIQGNAAGVNINGNALGVNITGDTGGITLSGGNSTIKVITGVAGDGIIYSADYSSTLQPLSLINKGYVDNLIVGLEFKKEVKASTTPAIGDINLTSAPSTLDGVTLVNGDRILVKDQSTGSARGIYIFNGTGNALTRSTDADQDNELANKTIPVTQGTVNADTWWTVRNDTVIVGTTTLLFSQTGGTGTYMQGTGLVLTGNIFSVDNTYITTATQTALNGKQATLVSGTNIKTIGTQSILGSGNITEVQNNLITSAILAPSVDTVNTALALKANLSGGNAWTGTQTSFNVTTQIAGTNSLLAASTAYVDTGLVLKVNKAGDTMTGTLTTNALIASIDAMYSIGSNIINYSQVNTNNLFSNTSLIIRSTGAFTLNFGNNGATKFQLTSTGTVLQNSTTQTVALGTTTNLWNGVFSTTGYFTAEVTGVTPTVSTSLTTKGYVDGLFLTTTATLDFPSTAVGTSSDLTVTLTGAVLGDVVTLGVPFASVVPNSSFSAFVSATDTITVRFLNADMLSARNPASGTFKIKILK